MVKEARRLPIPIDKFAVTPVAATAKWSDRADAGFWISVGPAIKAPVLDELGRKDRSR